MSNITKYVRDAFKSLDLLEDTSFDLSSKDDIKELGDFINDDGDIDPDAGVEVFDTEAETEDDLKTSYVGDVILCCPVCQAVHFDDFETVKEKHDEETDVYCVGEPCPVCGNEDGFEAIGEVKKFDPDFSEEDEVKVDAEGDDIDVEVKEKEEVREALRRKTVKRIAEKYSRGGKTIFRKDLKESKRLKEAPEGYNYDNLVSPIDKKIKDNNAIIEQLDDICSQKFEDFSCARRLNDLASSIKKAYIKTKFDVDDLYNGDRLTLGEAGDTGTKIYLTVNDYTDPLDKYFQIDLAFYLNDGSYMCWLMTPGEFASEVDEYIGTMDTSRFEDALVCANEITQDKIDQVFKQAYDRLDSVIAKSGFAFESKRNRKSLVKESKGVETRDVTDRVIVRKSEPGFISKMHELRDQGYECTGTGDGQMIFTKPKVLHTESKRIRESVSDWTTEDIQREIERIVEERFDGTDFWATVEEVNFDDGFLTLDIGAFDSEFEDLSRTVVFKIPRLDIENDLGDQLDNWMADHDSPDNFYEDKKSVRRGKKLTEVRNTTEADAEEFLESTIKVYDIASFIRSETDNKYTTHMADKWALIPTKKGDSFVFEDYEAVGELVKAGGNVKVDVEEYKEDSNTIQIFPSGYVEISTDEILALPAQEMKAKDFFTKWNYNSRCERNFTEMIEAIYGVGRLANESKEIGRGKRRNKLTEAPVYELRPQYDSRQSFYGKAQVDTGDKNDKNKLYSYGTLVAEIKDGKPVVYGTYSQTTLRHIKDWLKQNGFKADSSKQIITDYGAKNECKESFGKRKVYKLNESKGDLDKLDEEVKDIVGEVFDYTMDFDFLDIVADILLRTDDYEASAEDIDIVLNDLDSGLIYVDDQWEVLRYYFDSPGDLDSESWNDAFTHFAEDIQRVCSAIVENEEIKADAEEEEEEVEESFSKKSGKKIKEAVEDFDDYTPVEKEDEKKPLSFGKFVDKYIHPNYRIGGVMNDGSKMTPERAKKEYDEYLRKFNESLTEAIESATIETEDQVINVSSEDKEENMLDDFDPDFSNFDEVEEGGDEMIAPLSDEEVADLENGSEEDEFEDEETSEEEFPEDEEAEEEVDGIQEESFNRLVNNYLKKTYNNVESFKRTNVGTTGKQLRLEGVITFKSGKTKDTSFIFERVADKRTISKKSVRFVGMNETFTDKKNAFVLRAKLNNKKLVAESLRYEYPAKSSKLNEDVKIVKGLVK